MARSSNFGGKRAAPFVKGGGRKKSSLKTATGKPKPAKIIDPDGIPNNGDEYRLVKGKRVPVRARKRK